jgi:hypothetical protein
MSDLNHKEVIEKEKRLLNLIYTAAFKKWKNKQASPFPKSSLDSKSKEI